jgi:hypothetical protein
LIFSSLFSAGASPISTDILNHVANTIYVIVDVAMVAIPFRIQHVFHPILYAATYMVFYVIYELSGGHNALDKPYIYAALDWKVHQSSAAIYSVLSVLLATPLAFAGLFGICLAREAIYNNWFPKTEDGDESANNGFDYSRLDDDHATPASRTEDAGLPLSGPIIDETYGSRNDTHDDGQ